MKAIKAKTVLVLLVVLAAASWLYAQENAPAAGEDKKPIDYEALLEQAKQEFNRNKDQFTFNPVKPPDYLKDEKVMAAYRQAWQSYYDYLSQGLVFRLKVFRWQSLSTIIIFYTVLLLVFAGIVFSGIQFYKSMKVATDKNGQPDQPLTEFEASTSGIKVSSPVLGVILLVISLAFFYLYLVHVYPIQETF